MWPAITVGVLLAEAALFLALLHRQRALIRKLRDDRAEIQAEEGRVFDFLHGLGESFTQEIRPDELHRLIVEGATRVTGARHGALYLLHRDPDTLTPAHITRDAPPFISIPEHIRAQAQANPASLEGFLRLHLPRRDDRILGRVWERRTPLLLPRGAGPETGPTMLAPLIYAGRDLGVLAIGAGAGAPPFEAGDLRVFQSIAEQSAFALYTAVVFSLANEKKRIDAELRVAREVQRVLLPAAPPEIPGFDIAGLCLPATQVSGDYFDYLRIDPAHTSVAIADVCGKGVAASLLMAMCRSVLRGEAPGNPSPAAALHRLNRRLYPDLKEDMFITLALVMLPHDGSAPLLARAGHDAPLLYSASRRDVTRLTPPGLAVGIDRGEVFDRVTSDFPVPMQPGDCLLLYTDGVTETIDPSGEEFGVDRLVETLAAHADAPAASLLQHLAARIGEFAAGQPPRDDLTLVAIRRTRH